MPLPALPPRPDGLPWSPNTQTAYQTIVSTFDRGYQYLLRGERDPIRLRQIIEQLIQEAVPLLRALISLQGNVPAEEVPPLDWIELCLEMVTDLIEGLNLTLEGATGR